MITKFVDRMSKKFTIYNIGHDGGSVLWVEIGGKIHTASDYDEEKEEETTHEDFWPDIGHKWRGRYEEGSGIVSVIAPWKDESRPSVKLTNLLISTFNPKKMIVFS
jgi:hypothetical protein